MAFRGRGSVGIKTHATSPYDCDQMFALVADIEHYPDFLPDWRSAHIREKTESTILAHGVGLHWIRHPLIS